MSGDVPSGWREEKLGALAEIRRGASPRPISDPKWFSEIGPGWVRIADVTAASGQLLSTRQYLSDAGAAKSVRIAPGELIMSICATIGVPIISGIDACIHDGFVVFKDVSPDLDIGYLRHFLEAQTPKYEKLGQTGTQMNLNTEIIKTTPICLPPPAEQHRIAEILSSVDEAIQAAQAVIEQARTVKDGVLERLLTKGIGHTRFKQTEIGDIPEGWEAKALGEVCGLSGGAGFPIKYQGRDDLPYPFIKVSDMNLSGNEKFIIEYNNTIDQDIAKALKARPFPKGATIFPKVGAALLTNKRRILTRPTFVDNNIMVANPSSELDSEYLYHCFCRLDFSEYVQSGAVPSINQGTVGAIPIPVPPLSEQKVIADILRALDETEERLSTEMAQRHQLKASLASDLLTGRKRVSASFPLAAE